MEVPVPRIQLRHEGACTNLATPRERVRLEEAQVPVPNEGN